MTTHENDRQSALEREHRQTEEAQSAADGTSRQQATKTDKPFDYAELDPGIFVAVRNSRDDGLDTISSCEGGHGHPPPTTHNRLSRGHCGGTTCCGDTSKKLGRRPEFVTHEWCLRRRDREKQVPAPMPGNISGVRKCWPVASGIGLHFADLIQPSKTKNLASRFLRLRLWGWRFCRFNEVVNSVNLCWSLVCPAPPSCLVFGPYWTTFGLRLPVLALPSERRNVCPWGRQGTRSSGV